VKRYPVVLGATAAGLAGVLTFNSHPNTSLPHARGSSGESANKPSTSTPTNPPPTAPGSSSTSTTAPAGGATVKTVTGTLEQYGYGQLSVRVTGTGTRITKVTVGTLQTADQYSQQLATQVIPMLEREVLNAQSGQIQGVTGATYTSQAYALSVQSAIDKLRA
jgi:uncharacterized protein with FMN-binding domain